MLQFLDPVEQMAAVLHDAIEHTDLTIDQLVHAGYPASVVAAVDCLTHRDEETYEHYIDRVAGNATARKVKIEDINDNLANNLRSSSNPDNSERIDQYRRALRRLGGSEG